jgi:pyridoxal phosphate enzyme (YggS family)
VTVGDRLVAVRERIRLAASRAGRNPDEVKLVAVSKKIPAAAIREAHAAGQRFFGESYAQELVIKARELADLMDIEWHFVGHLQANKAKLVAEHAQVVHSVDTASVAHALGRRAAALRKTPLAVFVEVNVAGEPQKPGARPSEVEEVIRAVCEQPSLALRGLMTLPPAGNLAAAEQAFGTLASLRSVLGGARLLPDLSMGMSKDLEVAIANGSTYVRVGTAIFGHR